MGPIILSSNETASNADILQGTRLQTVPAGGILTFELQALVGTDTNNFVVSVQMPNGDTPLNNVLVPGCNPSASGVIDERQNLTVSFPIMQGGHCVFSATETGTSNLTWRVTYTPA
tara:strand:- start:1243 stop:1590 length:348 start_codon:yes stop_codon:yes gene_type:complete